MKETNKSKSQWCVKIEDDAHYLHIVKANRSTKKMYDSPIESVRIFGPDSMRKESNGVKFELCNGVIVILIWERYIPTDGCFPAQKPDSIQSFVLSMTRSCISQQQSENHIVETVVQSPAVAASPKAGEIEHNKLAQVTPLTPRFQRRYSMDNNCLRTPIRHRRKESTSTSSSSDGENVNAPDNGEDIQPSSKKSKAELVGAIPGFPKKNEETLSNAAFLSKIKSNNYIDVFEVPLDDLCDPGEYGIRAADPLHVRKLEDELINNPLVELISPIVVTVDPSYGDIDDFTRETIRCYRFLVLSGNHRRQALINIRNDDTRKKLLPNGFDIVKVHVYKGLSIEEARRLGLLMQTSSELVSPLGFGDKIKLCRSFLIDETNKRSNMKVSMTTFGTQKQLVHGVKAAVSSAMKTYLEKGNMNLYLSIASLPYDCFVMVVDICNLHRQRKLKGMKATAKHDDLKPYHLCFVRDLLQEELSELLQAVLDQDISLENASKRAREMKSLHQIQKRFCIETEISSWSKAREMFPMFTTEEQLGRFVGMPNPSSAFTSFCQRAIASLQKAQDIASVPNLKNGLRTIYFLSDLSNQEIFNGAHLSIITISDEQEDQLKSQLRRLKSANLQCRFSDYTIAIVYPIDRELMVQTALSAISPVVLEAPINIIQRCSDEKNASSKYRVQRTVQFRIQVSNFTQTPDQNVTNFRCKCLPDYVMVSDQLTIISTGELGSDTFNYLIENFGDHNVLLQTQNFRALAELLANKELNNARRMWNISADPTEAYNTVELYFGRKNTVHPNRIHEPTMSSVVSEALLYSEAFQLKIVKPAEHFVKIPVPYD